MAASVPFLSGGEAATAAPAGGGEREGMEWVIDGSVIAWSLVTLPLVSLHADYWHGSPLLSVSGHEKTPQILKTYGADNPPLKNAISRLVQPCYGVFGVIIGAV